MNRQKISEVVYYLSYYVFILTWIILIGSYIILFTNYSFIQNHINSWGKTVGEFAIIMLWIVSLAGILKRFQVKGLLQDLQIILMKSRRRIGITMFTLGLIHASWVRIFLYIQLHYIPTQLSDFNVFELCGILGLTLLFPLFITSNSYSVRILKKNWNRIHYLIYGTMWLIAIHVSLQGELKWAIPTYIIAILQILSRINEYRLKKIAAQLQPISTSSPQNTPQQPSSTVQSAQTQTPQQNRTSQNNQQKS